MKILLQAMHLLVVMALKMYTITQQSSITYYPGKRSYQQLQQSQLSYHY